MRAIQYSGTVVVKDRQRRLLDAPLSRGMTDYNFQLSASSNNAFSCARCFDIKPVAVAAAAARPA